MRPAIVMALALLFMPTAAMAEPETFVYRGAGCTGRDRMQSFETLLGRKADGVTEFAEQADWAHMLTSIDWALGCWEGKEYRLSQSVPMLMESGTSLEEGAKGSYDRHFVALGRLLVKRGHADAYLRIGWEFNGGWYKWSAAQNPEAFKRYFRRIVTAFRSVPGQKFKIVWNPAQGEQRIAPDKVWPGADAVDVVALDLYNQSWRPQDKQDAQARWDYLVSQPYGLAWLRAFAKEQGKPIALPEWGTGKRPDGHGGGDDAIFIANMAAWIKANNVVYHGYWDYPASDFDGEISTGRQPASAKAFREGFGSNR
ncbi:MAG: glycoside hydrolase family 26 protein [Sphingorhabdus sp.]